MVARGVCLGMGALGGKSRGNAAEFEKYVLMVSSHCRVPRATQGRGRALRGSARQIWRRSHAESHEHSARRCLIDRADRPMRNNADKIGATTMAIGFRTTSLKRRCAQRPTCCCPRCSGVTSCTLGAKGRAEGRAGGQGRAEQCRARERRAGARAGQWVRQSLGLSCF